VEEEEMNETTIRTKSTRLGLASFACGVVAVLSACGATAAQQSDASTGSTHAAAQAQISAGSSSLDYNTAQHLGQLVAGVGSTSLDYNTAQHMNRLEAGAGSSSLDYNTAQHMGLLENERE
jgi:hypothetical protein